MYDASVGTLGQNRDCSSHLSSSWSLWSSLWFLQSICWSIKDICHFYPSDKDQLWELEVQSQTNLDIINLHSSWRGKIATCWALWGRNSVLLPRFGPSSPPSRPWRERTGDWMSSTLSLRAFHFMETAIYILLLPFHRVRRILIISQSG